MRKQLLPALLLAMSPALLADDRGTLIFEDDFERSESQESTEEIGNGWASNSGKRAAGNKQVDLKDGAMHIYIHKAADHAVSVTHPAEFRDGSVEVRFMLENKEDVLGLNFADLQFKGVHAGHLFKVQVGVGKGEINDLKTGVMGMEIYTAKKAKTLTPAQKKMLLTKRKRFTNKVETGKWYDLLVEISGDTATVSIDDKKVASFSSEGIAHPTKRMLRLSIPKQAVVDDLKIYAKSAPAK